MAKGDYSVDLEALDEVGKKLNGVLRAMSKTKGESAHSTYMPRGTLGTGFEEETEFHTRHTEIKQDFEEKILNKLESLIDDLAKKTAQTRGAYEDREYDASNAVTPKVN